MNADSQILASLLAQGSQYCGGAAQTEDPHTGVAAASAGHWPLLSAGVNGAQRMIRHSLRHYCRHGRCQGQRDSVLGSERFEQMKKQLFVAAAVAMLLSCPSWALGSEGQSRITTEICKLENEADRAVVAHDHGFLSTLFANEYQHTNFVGSVADKKAEVDFFTSADFTLKNATIANCTVHVYQDVAVATGVNTWIEASYRGRNLSGSYRFTRVYVRRKGRWQIVASHASKITPA
jgi:hypothetical protein